VNEDELQAKIDEALRGYTESLHLPCDMVDGALLRGISSAVSTVIGQPLIVTVVPTQERLARFVGYVLPRTS
jgi:hypothetical protein